MQTLTKGKNGKQYTKHEFTLIAAIAICLLLLVSACTPSGTGNLMSGIKAGKAGKTVMNPAAHMALSMAGVVLPYADPRFAFVAVLPKEGMSVRALADAMDLVSLNATVSRSYGESRHFF